MRSGMEVGRGPFGNGETVVYTIDLVAANLSIAIFETLINNEIKNDFLGKAQVY